MGPSAVSLAWGEGESDPAHCCVQAVVKHLPVFTGALVIKGRTNPVKLSISLMEHEGRSPTTESLSVMTARTVRITAGL